MKSVTIPGAAPLSVARARQIVLERRLAVERAWTSGTAEQHHEAIRLYNEAREAYRLETGETIE